MNTKLNRKLIEKMIKRIETMPESYAQGTFGTKHEIVDIDEDILPRPKPACGTVACLAGEAVIVSGRSAKEGVSKLFQLMRDDAAEPETSAASLMGISEDQAEIIFWSAFDWPEPYRTQHLEAATYKGQARAAVNLLRAILRTDGKILEQR